MGRGGGTLGRLGKGSAAAGAGTGSGNVATADDALKAKVKTMEEMDEHRKLARAAERDLKVICHDSHGCHFEKLRHRTDVGADLRNCHRTHMNTPSFSGPAATRIRCCKAQCHSSYGFMAEDYANSEGKRLHFC